MTISNALHQFEQILIENDDYVGFAAEMILNQEKSNNEINETTVSIHMRRLQPSSGKNFISNCNDLAKT